MRWILRGTLSRTEVKIFMPSDSETTNPDFLTTQYEQAMETFRHGVTSLAQLVTVFVLADITLLGFAIDKAVQLRRLDISMFGRRKTLVNLLLVLVTSIHVMAPLLLTSYFAWKLL